MSTTTPKNKIRLVILISIILITTFTSLSFALAQGNDYGLTKTAETAGLTNTGSNADLPILIGNIIYAFLGFLGVVFFILVLYGGFTWMTAQGNKEQTTKARGIITSAAIGLIIVLASYAVTSFVMGEVISGTGIGGNSISTQCVCSPGSDPVSACITPLTPGNTSSCGPSLTTGGSVDCSLETPQPQVCCCTQ